MTALWRPAELDVDEAGRMTAKRANGSVMSVPSAAQLMSNPRLAHLRSTVAQTAATSATLAPSEASKVAGTTAWIEAVVRSAADCERQSNAVSAHASLAGRDEQGRDHYVHATPRGYTEFVVDPKRHLILETINQIDDTTIHSVSSYVDGPAGLRIRSRVVTEQRLGPKASQRGPIVTTISVSKAVVDGAEVIP
jgi:hypothetical protein